ncbi:MAG TPA: PaaX family transcriptional regulator C-terminal domain-containing protein [Pseudonocardia sp.]|nr:PaaX family transcriptional regulator C-terminal domain-containing protein [Pseudonocardia sp.]
MVTPTSPASTGPPDSSGPRPGHPAQDQPTPGPSRRRELGAPSGRSLLLTVLGEFVLPRGRPVWTQVLLDVLSGLGVEPKSARQALARTAAEGLLDSERDGRRVRWSLTTSGRALLSEGAERIYGFGAPGPAWDGRWLVVLVSVPESRRQLRHRLRSRLAWAGMGSPAPGVWLSPHPGKQHEVARVIEELELVGVSSSFVGEFGAVGHERELMAQAWNLAEVEAAYQDFIAAFSTEDPRNPDEVMRAQIRLVHQWRRFPFLDPQLPAELLPISWPGPLAYSLFHDLHGRWALDAGRCWDGLFERLAGA